MNRLFDDVLKTRPGPVGVAVSGGGDSVALLVLLKEAGADLRAYTVDHGLRSEAAAEAAGVAALCERLKVPHLVLRWTERPDGNTQAAARVARYRLLAEAAAQDGAALVALGHTLDDQAETFLMRLRRGSGVDGLSAMAPLVTHHGLDWWRPLLDVRREELRAVLRSRGIGWVDDPTNEDDSFERVRVRRALETLEEVGLTPEALSETARRMARARQVLDAQVEALAEQAADARDSGAVRLDIAALAEAAAEIRFRLLAHGLMWVSGAQYRPRMTSLEAAWIAVRAGTAQTLHGCRLVPSGETLEIAREINAMPVAAAGGEYDGRWHTDPADGIVRPLGEAGLARCPDWRATGESRIALEATPSLWQNGELRSAPFGRNTDAWQCRLIGGADGFYSSIRSH